MHVHLRAMHNNVTIPAAANTHGTKAEFECSLQSASGAPGAPAVNKQHASLSPVSFR